jgi:hypothetical protein
VGGTPVVPVPEPRANIQPANQFRSTWIVSSHDGLRQFGYFNRYQALLGEHREQILTCVAAVWLPLDVARTHYQACEQLRITDAQYLEMANAAGQVRKAWNAVLIAGAERAEATPWTVLATLPRAWARAANGGAVGVYQLAETQARVEYVGCELLEIPYFRRAVRVMIQLLVGHSCDTLLVSELRDRAPATCAYLAQWA